MTNIEKVSYIGSWRYADNRGHFDRCHGRPAPQDFIVRIKGTEIEFIPSINAEIQKRVLLALSLIIGTKQRLPAVEVVDDISTQIYQTI